MKPQFLTPQQMENLSNAPAQFPKSSTSELQAPFLGVLSSAGRELIAQLISEKNYEAGQLVFKEGNSGDAMYIIRSGRVVILKGNLDAPAVLGYRGVGELVGEMALLEHRPRSATIVAVEPVRLLAITRTDFEVLISRNPSVGLSILSTLSARLRAADDARRSISRSESKLVKQVNQLQTEKQKLLELEQLRQDTIDLIVHDLRHPLSSLLGAIKILEMVLPTEVIEENQQLFEIANSNCDHLQLMVESILDVARMEAGTAQLDLEALSLSAAIDDAVKRVNILADIENISIDILLPGDLPAVQADEKKLSRILGNLLNNALKYTPGGGLVTVSAEANNGVVQVKVADTGPGIPEEDRERVFDRFAQISGRNRVRTTGFGLGLAFCRMAVEAHGGNIWVESYNNQGSQFVFTLPQSA